MTGYMFLLLGIILIVELLELLLLYVGTGFRVERYRKDYNDRKVEKAQNVEKEEKANPIDEGIENILSYSVSGKTGFEGSNND